MEGTMGRCPPMSEKYEGDEGAWQN
jgi:hypothetical protein